MKFLKNRKVLAAISIILSLGICFGLAPMYNAKLEAKTEVIRIKEKVKKGDLIEEKNLEIVEVGGYNLTGNVIKDKETVKGKYAKADMYPGEYVLQDKLSVEPLGKDIYLSHIQPNQKAISISIKSLATGFSDKLQPGDIVSIIATQYGEESLTIQPKELNFLEVLAVTESKGNDKDRTKTKEKENTDEQDLGATITLIANEAQALKLADLEANGIAHIAFVYRGEVEHKKMYLEKQNEILNAKGE